MSELRVQTPSYVGCLRRTPTLAALLCLGGCLEVGPQDPALPDPSANPVTITNHVHAMPIRERAGQDASAATFQASSAPTGAHLTYYGGKVIQNANVVQVLYGGGSYLPQITSTAGVSMASTYTQIVTSGVFDWLNEYNTASPAQTIGRGSFAGMVQIAPAAARNGSTIVDASIQAELAAQINAGTLPAATDNNLYMVHFPAGKTVINPQGEISCVDICAYHGTFKIAAQNVYYGVLPDLNAGACPTGCGAAPTLFQNQQSAASHELIEAITDAEVGFYAGLQAPLAWYDGNNGEIGDICNQQQFTFTGTDGNNYTIQKEFSNLQNDCITSRTLPMPTSGLHLWLRADADVYNGATLLTSTGLASQWRDQSGNGRTASMATTTRQPTFVPGALNGRPVIRFSGAQSMNLNVFSQPTLFSVFVVGKNSLTSESFSMILGPGGNSPNNQLRWNNGSQALFVTQNAGTIVTSPIGNTRVYHALSARYDGSTMTFYRDGNAMSSTNFTTTAPWTIASVGSWYSTYYMTGDLAEVIIYDRALSEAERASVNAYLRSKYNLP